MDDGEAIHDLNERCFEWLTPDDMRIIVEDLRSVLKRKTMLRPGRVFREAFAASTLAARRGASRVRLLRETVRATPDFEIEVDGQYLRFETTEADVPGRRRQDEYQEPARVEPMFMTNMDAMVPTLERLVDKKCAKSYESCQGLLIWFNPPMLSFNPAVRWGALLAATRAAAAVFDEVWIVRVEGAPLYMNREAQPEPANGNF